MNNVNTNVENITDHIYSNKGKYLSNVLVSYNNIDFTRFMNLIKQIRLPPEFLNNFDIKYIKKSIWDQYKKCFELYENYGSSGDAYINIGRKNTFCNYQTQREFDTQKRIGVILSTELHISLHKTYVKTQKARFSSSIHIKFYEKDGYDRYDRTVLNFGVNKLGQISAKNFDNKSIYKKNQESIVRVLENIILNYYKKISNTQLDNYINEYFEIFITLLYTLIGFVVFIYEDVIKKQKQLISSMFENLKVSELELIFYLFLLQEKIKKSIAFFYTKHTNKHKKEEIMNHKYNIVKFLVKSDKFTNEIPQSLHNLWNQLRNETENILEFLNIHNHDFFDYIKMNMNKLNITKNLDKKDIDELTIFILENFIFEDFEINDDIGEDDIRKAFVKKLELDKNINNNKIENWTLNELFKYIIRKLSDKFDKYSIDDVLSKINETENAIKSEEQKIIYKKYKNEFSQTKKFIDNLKKSILSIYNEYKRIINKK